MDFLHAVKDAQRADVLACGIDMWAHRSGYQDISDIRRHSWFEGPQLSDIASSQRAWLWCQDFCPREDPLTDVVARM